MNAVNGENGTRDGASKRADEPGRLEIIAMAGFGLLLTAALVALTLRRDPPPTFPITEPDPPR